MKSRKKGSQGGTPGVGRPGGPLVPPGHRLWRHLPIATACALLPAFCVQAADPVGDFLAAAQQEILTPRLPGDPGSSVNWLEKMQVRLSRDSSDDRRQTYAARFHIKSPGQYQAETRILDLDARKISSDYRMALDKALKARYQLLVTLYYLREETRILRLERDLASTEVETHRLLSRSEQFRPKSLQAAELLLQRTQARVDLSQRRLDRMRRNMAAMTGPAAPPQGFAGLELLPLPQLGKLIDGLHPTRDEPDDRTGGVPNLETAVLESDLARQRLRREEKRRGFALRFMELSYDHDRSDDVFELTVGIDFPTGKSSFGVEEQRLQLLDREYRLHRTRQILERRQGSAWDEIQMLLAEAQLDQAAMEQLNQRLERQTGSDSNLLALDLKKEKLRMLQRQVQTRRRIYRQTIEYLSVTGRLAQEPLRNWLMSGQPRI